MKRCKRGRGRTTEERSNSDGAALEFLAHEGVLSNVLVFLPLRKLYELRLVCKSWNSLLRSRAFLQAWSCAGAGDNDDGKTCWLVMVRKLPAGPPFARELIAYDAATGSWISLLPCLTSCPPLVLSALGGPSCCCVDNRFKNPHLPSLFEFMASSARGLVCFLHSPFRTTEPTDQLARGAYSLLVLNLLTGSHNLLPSPPKHSDDLRMRDPLLRISMQALSGTCSSYRVFLQSQWFCFPGPLEIYDSQSRSWKVGRSCRAPTEAKLAGAADLERADLLQYMDETRTVFAYSVDLDEWSQVSAHPVTLGRRRLYHYNNNGYLLVRHRGRVLLAVVESKCSLAGESKCLAGFAVLELHLHHPSPASSAAPGTAAADWVEVARTPRHYWKGFYGIDPSNHEVIEAKIISSGSLICMTAVHYTDTNYGGTYYRPLVYDLVRDSWYHLPAYKGGKDFIGAFSLQPSFAATA